MNVTVEHRNYMKNLHLEFYEIITMKCRICNYTNINDHFYAVDFFINKKYNLRSNWCSVDCFECSDKENKIQVEKYKNSVNEYMVKDTIEYDKDAPFI
jgi:hypothetical protein